MHHESGRKVSLVGWSLGGVFALYGAHQAPRMRAQRHHAGQPGHRRRRGQRSRRRCVKALYRLIAHPMGPAAHVDAAARQEAARAQAAAGADELPVFAERRRRAAAGGHASTATRRCTRTSASAAATSGWASTPLVLWIVADRLAQPEGQWQPFAAVGRVGAAVPAADARGACRSSAPPGAAPRRLRGARASARYSWKLSRTHCAKTSGSGISSRHEVGEMMMRPS